MARVSGTNPQAAGLLDDTCILSQIIFVEILYKNILYTINLLYELQTLFDCLLKMTYFAYNNHDLSYRHYLISEEDVAIT